MKLMFASDIHGAEAACRRMCDVFDQEKPDALVLLGDILYHGPRNNLPGDYAPRGVIDMLNARAAKILAVRGNCDSEVDNMVLHFPVCADYALVCPDDVRMFVTHGHLDCYDDALAATAADSATTRVYMQGHTHVGQIEKRGGTYYLNPGSIGIPKDDSGGSYMIYERGEIFLKALADSCVLKHARITKDARP